MIIPLNSWDKAMKNGRRTGYLLAGIYLSLVTQGTCIPASSRPSSFLKFLPSPELPDLHPSSMISHPPTAYKSSFKSLPPSSLPFPSLPFLFSPSSKHQEGPMVHQLPSENHNDAVQNNQGLRYIPVYMINSKPQRYREDSFPSDWFLEAPREISNTKVGENTEVNALNLETLQPRPRRRFDCLINGGFSHNCDYRNALGAAEESKYWGHSSPGKRIPETLENMENIQNRVMKGVYTRIGRSADLQRKTRATKGLFMRVGRSGKSDFSTYPDDLPYPDISSYPDISFYPDFPSYLDDES
ncbi:uncharacterized protein LOC111708471 isoform X2 [Eurytemora carolleeae]|uniref:uncharacterized protein LOC111708471 isoform X2 n=1 Tax=Eurytemora carolleeae TaxID=1294199 RepID=UPI000C770D87|nr:uncharacterized protein LOC111708471 isoform X2 [Eurytemora carolleeae]|eukprot:XP_023337619.1 uncharacterized protein LOC111708471 isoform X2 [Eurytemora affinis]